MPSRFTVTSPASDLSLLSINELREAAGQETSDAALATLGQQVALALARACGIAADGVNPPTLRQEVCTEVFRQTKCSPYLMLARRPVTSVSSVTIGADLQASGTYEIDQALGRLVRLSGDCEIDWPVGKTTIVYAAGYAAVPADIKLAAAKLVKLLAAEAPRDPNLKRENVPGVLEREWWVAPSGDPLLSAEIVELLAPYRQYWI